MRRDGEGGGDIGTGEGGETGDEGRDLLTQMIGSLLSGANAPPKEVEGVSEEFCDGIPFLPLSIYQGTTDTVHSPRPRPAQISNTQPNLSHLQQPLPGRRIPPRCAIALSSHPSVRSRVCAALAAAEGHVSA